MAWKIDSPHTAVYFTARHMMIANVRGRFENISGHVDLNEEDPIYSSVEVTIDAASINTREVQRDAHLRSAGFSMSKNTRSLLSKAPG
jgi:polyisoprenoid-binding protein YceI